MPRSDSNNRPPQAAFATEALRHLDQLAGFARWIAGSETDADDLVQETYLKAFRNWGRYQPGTDCRAWLYTICRNTYLTGRARETRVEAVEDSELEALAAAAMHTSAATSGLEDVFDRFDLRDAVRREVQALSLAIREVVVLVDLEDWSYASTAIALAIPIGTVRSRLFRGRRLLQQRLLAHARDAGIVGRTDPPDEE